MSAALQQSRSQMSEQIRQRSAEEHAKTMLERARWAAAAFAGLDRERTLKIARAAADAGYAKAAQYGDWAVKETGFGVAAHKRIKTTPINSQCMMLRMVRSFSGLSVGTKPCFRSLLQDRNSMVG